RLLSIQDALEAVALSAQAVWKQRLQYRLLLQGNVQPVSFPPGQRSRPNEGTSVTGHVHQAILPTTWKVGSERLHNSLPQPPGNLRIHCAVVVAQVPVVTGKQFIPANARKDYLDALRGQLRHQVGRGDRTIRDWLLKVPHQFRQQRTDRRLNLDLVVIATKSLGYLVSPGQFIVVTFGPSARVT